jgi:hypothetical protein
MKQLAGTGHYRLAMLRTGGAVVVLAVVVGACSSGGPKTHTIVINPDQDASTREGDASTEGAFDGGTEASVPSGCAAAGGQCIAGDGICWGLPTASAVGQPALCGSPDAVCCLVVFDAGNSCTDASATTVWASSYDQSCTVDTDCVGVSEGDSCNPCDFNCVNAAINAGGLPQYASDTAYFPAVLAVAKGACASSCGGPETACCIGGTCHWGYFMCPADAGNIADAAVDADAEGGAGRVPVNHRPSDAQCSTPAPPGNCGGPYPNPDAGGCARDSDCTEAGTNGRCINRGGGPAAPCFCTYDTCILDTDCPSGQTCACHGARYTDARGNTCMKGNCRVDADCGARGYCSPSSNTGICGDSLAGYYCHTAADLCIDDSDCPESSVGTSGTITVGNPGCVYSTTDSRWECIIVPVCE